MSRSEGCAGRRSSRRRHRREAGDSHLKASVAASALPPRAELAAATRTTKKRQPSNHVPQAVRVRPRRCRRPPRRGRRFRWGSGRTGRRAPGGSRFPRWQSAADAAFEIRENVSVVALRVRIGRPRSQSLPGRDPGAGVQAAEDLQEDPGIF